MPSYTIVAIPSKDDYVWKISSEKVPHLTLLMLGDTLNNVPRVTEFIQHATDTMLSRFGLSVDYRDTLGPKEADALFFNDYCLKNLIDFRASLLKNKDIMIAYNSIPQYPIWTPHLTLGYPTSPAKPDNREYPISWIDFDRIALWTSDFEGPEFELYKSSKNQYGMAMSSIANDQTMTIEQALEHHGVLGMHWGKRKARAEAARAPGYSTYQQNSDRFNYGRGGTDRINEHLNNGMDINAARKAELKYRRRRALLVAGTAYAALLLVRHGPTLLQGLANNYVGNKAAEAAAKAAASVLADSRGIGNHKLVDLGYDAATGVWK